MEKVVQWYPGHMAKAYRLIKEKIGLLDVVIEVLDARAPLSSFNKTIREVIGNKPLLLVLNKADLADEKETKKWVEYYKDNYYVLPLDSLNGKKNIGLINDAILDLLKEKIDKAKSLGKNIYPLKAMVLGIPNVGKSTLLNNLAKRRALEVGDRPGVTKAMQYLKASDKLLLLDNPGTLWPKFEDQTQANTIALIGSIKDDILPIPKIASYALDLLKDKYPNLLKERYNLNSLDYTDEELFIEIGKKRGKIKKGGEVDLDQVYDLFLKDIRSGRIGRMSFESRE